MSRTPVVGHLRGLVQVPADAMPDIFVHHAEPAFLHIGLHRTANVTDPRTHPHHRKSGLQAFAGGIHQRLGLRIHRADREGRSRVPVVSVIQGAYVDADDVAFSENPFTGDPVDNLFIHRDARAARKTTIPQKRGFGSL